MKGPAGGQTLNFNGFQGFSAALGFASICLETVRPVTGEKAFFVAHRTAMGNKLLSPRRNFKSTNRPNGYIVSIS